MRTSSDEAVWRAWRERPQFERDLDKAYQGDIRPLRQYLLDAADGKVRAQARHLEALAEFLHLRRAQLRHGRKMPNRARELEQHIARRVRKVQQGKRLCSKEKRKRILAVCSELYEQEGVNYHLVDDQVAENKAKKEWAEKLKVNNKLKDVVINYLRMDRILALLKRGRPRR